MSRGNRRCREVLAWHQRRKLAVGFVPCMEPLLGRAWRGRRLQLTARPKSILELPDVVDEVWLIQIHLESFPDFPARKVSTPAPLPALSSSPLNRVAKDLLQDDDDSLPS